MFTIEWISETQQRLSKRKGERQMKTEKFHYFFVEFFSPFHFSIFVLSFLDEEFAEH